MRPAPHCGAGGAEFAQALCAGVAHARRLASLFVRCCQGFAAPRRWRALDSAARSGCATVSASGLERARRWRLRRCRQCAARTRLDNGNARATSPRPPGAVAACGFAVATLLAHSPQAAPAPPSAPASGGALACAAARRSSAKGKPEFKKGWLQENPRQKLASRKPGFKKSKRLAQAQRRAVMACGVAVAALLAPVPRAMPALSACAGAGGVARLGQRRCAAMREKRQQRV